jgi:mannitol-specific phosphotransferase system IIBC component
MLGKIIGAVAGRRVSKHISGVSGPGGAVLGVAAAALMRRMGPMGMVAAAVGGWALKRHFDKQEPTPPNVAPRPPR